MAFANKHINSRNITHAMFATTMSGISYDPNIIMREYGFTRNKNKDIWEYTLNGEDPLTISAELTVDLFKSHDLEIFVSNELKEYKMRIDPSNKLKRMVRSAKIRHGRSKNNKRNT